MIDYRDIPVRIKILGKLQVPMFELVTIRGTWVTIEGPKPTGPIFIVDSVNGQHLDPPAEFPVIVPVNSIEEVTAANGEAWEMRGVEKGEFVGFPRELWDELAPTRAPASPTANGFQTRFYYYNARRISK